MANQPGHWEEQHVAQGAGKYLRRKGPSALPDIVRAVVGLSPSKWFHVLPKWRFADSPEMRVHTRVHVLTLPGSVVGLRGPGPLSFLELLGARKSKPGGWGVLFPCSGAGSLSSHTS